MRQLFTLLRGTLVTVMAMILCSLTVNAPVATNQTEQSVNYSSKKIVLPDYHAIDFVVSPSQEIVESKITEEKTPEGSVLQVLTKSKLTEEAVEESVTQVIASMESKSTKEAVEESVTQIIASTESKSTEEALVIQDDANYDTETINIMVFPEIEIVTFPEIETEIDETKPQSDVNENASSITENNENQLFPLLSEINEKSKTEDRIMALFGFFMSEGFSAPAAAGVIGNIASESAFNPSAVNSSGYYGLCQWNTSDGGGHWWDGQNGIREWLFTNGYAETSFEGQARAIIYCSNRGFLTDERLEKLKKMESPAEAVEYFCRYYEIGAGTSVRINEAIEVLRVFEDPTAMYAGERPYVPK